MLKIKIEGNMAEGKTTLMHIIGKVLQERGYKVIGFENDGPGGGRTVTFNEFTDPGTLNEKREVNIYTEE